GDPLRSRGAPRVPLSPPHPAGPVEGGEHPLQAGQLVADRRRRAALAGGSDLDRDERAVRAGGQHRNEPGVGAVGRVDLDDQAGPVGVDNRFRPSVEAGCDLRRLSGRRRRSVGTAAPLATCRTPATATRPSQWALGPTSSPPNPAPIATSQPRASAMAIDAASANSPPGSGTPRWARHPSAGPPIAS